MDKQTTLRFGLEDIQKAAQQFVGAVGRNRVIALYGPMGAGKTTFVRALCHELGVTDEVTSPTFAIVNEYEGGDGPVYHFDFYRVRNLSEAIDMGCNDYFYSGRPCLIEWPELVEPLLPEDALRVDIAETPDGLRTLSW